MASYLDDYTKYRTIDPLNPPYEIEDIIGRKDPTYFSVVQNMPTTFSGVTVSGSKSGEGTSYGLRTNYR